MARHVLTAELAEDLAGSLRAIFIDAAADGEPGEVRVRTLTPDASAVSTMAHFLDPSELLAWCEALYGHAPQAWLVTVTGDSFDYSSSTLTPTAAAAMPVAVERTRALLEA
jgi:hydrogenase maturation protease